MFDDIRPYRNDELTQVVHHILNDPEFQTSVALYVMPKLGRLFPWISRQIVRLSLQRRAKKLTNIRQLQLEVASYIYNMIERSTDGFSHDGVDKLDLSKPMVFVSNHRDIALDPALVNVALHEHGCDTTEIAIGDNLLSKPWIADFMRVNKSFVVKREASSKREMLNNSKQLSAYVHHTLINNHHSLWIAQRGGRAKNGLDVTNPALISMLLLNKEKHQTIGDYLRTLNIVPVSISYQYDPCDATKAIELAAVEQFGQYEKQQHEDIKSITQGIVGHKGRVHMSFGQPIQGEFNDSKAIAAAIDAHIIGHYKLYDSNLTAYALLHEQGKGVELKVKAKFDQRMANLNDQQKKWLLTMYANPVVAKKALNAGSSQEPPTTASQNDN